MTCAQALNQLFTKKHLLGVLELEVEVLVRLVGSPPAHQSHHVSENLGDGPGVAALGGTLSNRLGAKKQREGGGKADSTLKARLAQGGQRMV